MTDPKEIATQGSELARRYQEELAWRRDATEAIHRLYGVWRTTPPLQIVDALDEPMECLKRIADVADRVEEGAER